jgi:hypothetical protein
MRFIIVEALDLLGAISAHANLAFVESVLRIQFVAERKNAGEDHDVGWRELRQTAGATLVTTIEMFAKTIEPFTLEGTFHGNAPMFGSDQTSVGGASNGANNVEAGGVEGVNGGDSNGDRRGVTSRRRVKVCKKRRSRHRKDGRGGSSRVMNAKD